MAQKPVKKPRFRDERGRFVAGEDRYTKATRAYVWRNNKWRQVLSAKVTPASLANVTNRDEFEVLPPSMKLVKDFVPSNTKYKAWDVAKQIDATRGIRKHLLKVTMNIRDGKRLRKVSFFRKLKRNSPGSYLLFTGMNDAIGAEKLYFYKSAGSKIMSDRKGKKVKLESVKVEKVL